MKTDRCGKEEKMARRIRDVMSEGEISKRQNFFKKVFSEWNQFANEDEVEDDNVDEEDNVFKF